MEKRERHGAGGGDAGGTRVSGWVLANCVLWSKGVVGGGGHSVCNGVLAVVAERGWGTLSSARC